MKVEAKLAINSMKRNKKRTFFTIISIVLCTALISTTFIVISSIKNGITQNVETQYNDYHFIIKNVPSESLSKIKDKKYIEKIYVQEYGKDKIEEINKENSYNLEKNINIYIKYKEARKLCVNTTDIIKTLNLSYDELMNQEEMSDSQTKYGFNENLLTIYGLIYPNIKVGKTSPVCVVEMNYTYVLDVMSAFIVIAFSILFIVILYNAFLITINERRREYAVLNSIGSTEGQILKIIFTEGLIFGIVGIIIGGIISIISSNIIIQNINNLLIEMGYNLKVIYDIKYIMLAIAIILINLYISSVIPSIKASSTSIIQDIRSNKKVKYKRTSGILEGITTVEGRLAYKNIKRNSGKYKIITFLLIICITSYISISTYISYEKYIADLVTKYDVDAQLYVGETGENVLNLEDYKEIIKDYNKKYFKNIDSINYKMSSQLDISIEPSDAINWDIPVINETERSNKIIQAFIVGLNNDMYKNCIKDLKANYGDVIIYNNIKNQITLNNENEVSQYYEIIKDTSNIKLNIMKSIEVINDDENQDYEEDEEYEENSKFEYITVDEDSLNNGKVVLIDEPIEGFKEIKTVYDIPTIFVNMDTYNKIEENLKNENEENMSVGNTEAIKIKCDNVIEFANYIQDISIKKNCPIIVEYYTLENKEKIIYISVLENILNTIMTSIIVLGIVSTVNIINSSLCERKYDFKILYSLGATKENINKMLINEGIYIFIKALIISILLSIPILYAIIKYMENVVIINKLLVPYQNICIFIVVLFLLSFIITIFSTKFIEEE